MTFLLIKHSLNFFYFLLLANLSHDSNDGRYREQIRQNSKDDNTPAIHPRDPSSFGSKGCFIIDHVNRLKILTLLYLTIT